MNPALKFTRVFALAVALFALAFVIECPGATAFQSLTPQSAALTRAKKSQKFLSTTALGVSNHGREEDFFEDESDNSDVPVLQTKSAEELKRAAFWKQAKDINNKFWDYTCVFCYVGISCLILLNFCGFGYTITREDGLNVMPLQEYRQERQWKEVQKQHVQAIVRPASALQQAPAAFLLQQQQK